MKLKFKKDYISIKHFEPVEIPSFTILTGINGSGKTHLLLGIKNGSIEIEGVDQSEIVYYNYNDFTIHTGNIDASRIDEWKSSRQYLIQKMNQLKDSVYEKTHRDKSGIDKIIYSLVKHKSLDDFELFYAKDEDYKKIEAIRNILKKDDQIEKLISPLESEITWELYNLLFSYLVHHNGDINEIKKDFLKAKFTRLSTEFQEALKNEDIELYTFLEKNVNKKLTSFTHNDFESPHLLLQDIASEEKQYQIIKDQNIINKGRATEYGEKVDFIEKENFLKKYGLSPIEEINKVLEVYDCNGYSLVELNKRSFLGIDNNNISIDINLQQLNEGYTTNFEQLSSGEKTLIALSLLIYKSKKNRIIPRILLLDEIDSSLHPSMIKRLLNVIEKLFIEEQGLKIILATHSPTTVALSPENSIFIVNKNNQPKISKQNKSKAIDLLTEGFATLNMEDTSMSIDYNISQTLLPILFTEGITDKIIIETAWKKIYDTKAMPFYIQDCFDAKFLGNLFRRGYDEQDGIIVNHSEKKLIALFDFDSEGYNAWNSLEKLPIVQTDPLKGLTRKNNEGNAYAILTPISSNPEVKKQVIKKDNETFKDKSLHPIELLFYGVEELKKYFTIEQIPGSGQIISFKGKKRDFANVIKNADPKSFNEFKSLFNQLEIIIAHMNGTKK